MDIRALNRALNSEEFRLGRLSLRSKPRYVLVELTQGCNLSCEMCRNSRIPLDARRMPKELFDRIAEDLFPTADIVDLRGWGESLLLPDIAVFIRRVVESGAAMRFVSNLSFHRPDVIQLLTEYHAYVAVSVDTADAALLRRLRGGARLDLIKRNLAELVAGYIRRWGSTERLSIGCTVQRPALEGLSGVVELAAEVGIRHLRLFAVEVPDDSDLSLEGHEEAIASTLVRVVETARRVGVAVSAGTCLGDVIPPPAPVRSCLRYWSSATVSYAGLVGFCDHLIGPLTETEGIGSLQTESFEALWNGRLIQSLRAGVLQNAAECRKCRTKRHIEFEDLFEPDLARERQWLTPPCPSGPNRELGDVETSRG